MFSILNKQEMQLINSYPLGLSSVIFVVTWIIDNYTLSNQKHQLLRWEVMRMVNYGMWSCVSVCALLWHTTDSLIYTSFMFLTNSITLNYLYEVYAHKPDIMHQLHHYISLFLKWLWVLQYMYNTTDPTFIWMITIVAHINTIGTISSIFSSYRQVAKMLFSRRHYDTATMMYKRIYVVSKVSSAMCSYISVYSTTFRSYKSYIVCMATLTVVQAIQVFFVYKMYKRK